MKESNQKRTELSQLNILPLKFRKCLKKLSTNGFIEKDLIPEIEPALLEAINNGELILYYSPIYPESILPNEKEIIVWLKCHLSSVFKKEQYGTKIQQKNNEQLALVYIDDIEKYELFWKKDIKGSAIAKKSTNIIENYEEMLPIILKTKNESLKLIGRLPYLGIPDGDGKLILFEEEILRPNYFKIKSDNLISLKDCIRILLGVEDLKLFEIKEMHLKEIRRGRTKDTGNRKLSDPEPALFEKKKRQKSLEYREGWHDIVLFINKFLIKVQNQVDAGFLEMFDCEQMSDNWREVPIRHTVNNLHKGSFRTLDFIKWAKNSGYVIPDELYFIENKDGTLQWGDSDIVDQTENKSRCFISRNDGTWKIIFDGESDSFKIGKPIQYMAEILKQPHGKTINYIKLAQLVEGTHIENKSIESHDLNIESSGRKHTARDKEKMRRALGIQYERYLIDPVKEKDNWMKAKEFAQTEYGIIAKDEAGELSFTESKWQNEKNPEYEKVRKTVSANKNRFLKAIKNFSTLHQHFTTYLKAENGITYDPPKGSPTWKIISK